jgi:hypothetical protein
MRSSSETVMRQIAMSAKSLKEFNRGLAMAEAVIEQVPHGSQRDALLMKLYKVRNLGEDLLGSIIEPPTSGMLGQMS